MFMKIFLFFVFTSLIQLSLSCSIRDDQGSSTSSLTAGATADNDGVGFAFDRTWTVMVYMAGDNSLETELLNDLNEMERIDYNGRGVNLLVLADRAFGGTSADGDWTGSRLYFVSHDTDSRLVSSVRLADPDYLKLSAIGDNEELDMGDPETLSLFIEFCKTMYPADHYAVILWDHGDGWRPADSGALKSGRKKAVCVDETSGSVLSMDGVESALRGKNINLIGFDACLMGMAEVAYQLTDPLSNQGYPAYMVASEANEPASGWAYNQLFLKFMMESERSPYNLGKSIIDSYSAANSEYTTLTLSLVNLAAIPDLVRDLDNFLTQLSAVSADDICQARADVTAFEYHNIDLGDFAERFPHVNGASNLLLSLKNAVLYHKSPPELKASGLSIYFPLDSALDPYYPRYTNSIRFTHASQWDEFLEDYYSRVSRTIIETISNMGGGRTDTYLSLFTEDLYPLASNDDIDAENYNLYSRISFPLARGRTYYLLCRSATYKNLGPYSIRYGTNISGYSTGNPLSNAYEPNNDYGSSTFLPFDTVQDHQLEFYGDDDWFRITLP